MSVTPRTITQTTHGPPRVTPSGGAPPGGPPGTGFDLILQLEAQARTAPAEGREAQTDITKGAVTEQDAPQTTETPAPGSTPAEVTEPAADVPATPEAPTAPQAEPVLEGETSTTTTGDAPASPAVPALEGAETVPQQGVEAPAAPPGGTSPKPEVTVPALEGAGTVAGPAGSETAAPLATSEPETATTPQQPAAPVAATEGDGKEPNPNANPSAPGKPDGPRGPETAPHGHANGHDQNGKRGDEQAADQPAAASTPAATNSQAAHANPVASPPPVQPAVVTPMPHTGPLLAPQVQRMQALVDLAIQRGGTASANLELYPAELGKVQVRLRSGSGGLSATMTVDRPEALQALQAAADQLRQSLEDQGVEIVRLEIGLSAQARGDEAKTGARSDGRDASGGTTRRGGMDAVTDHDHDDAAPTMRPLIPGALVDVRA